MQAEEHFRKLERAYLSAPINEYYKPDLRITEGAARLRIRVRDEFHHAAGAVHGSVYFKALDDAAFFAANSLVRDFFVLTSSFHIHLMGPVQAGEIIAQGTVINRSRRLLIASAELENADGKLLAQGSGTFLTSTIELSEEIGYC